MSPPRSVNFLRAAFTVGSLTALSRVTGFVRDLMIAAILGAGPLADAFFVAFKLSNFLRRLFAEGAFNAGFVPLFARTLEGEGRDAAKRFGEEALAIMTTVLLIVVLLAEIFMPVLVRLLATGFEPGGERYTAAVELSRITFPYLMLISLAALFSGVLNSFGKFAAAAFAPVLLNLVLIGSLLLSSLHPQTPAHALAWGVAAAGVLQLSWVIAACARSGMVFALRLPRITSRIKKLFGLVLPGIVGAGVAQINLLVDMWFASHLQVGAVSYLFYADRINQLPLGIVGIAIGTALLPTLSRHLRAGRQQEAATTQNRGVELSLLLTLPAAAALIVIAEPIVRVLFERGAFGAEDTAATAAALMAFAIGLPAYVLIKVLVPAFFAREDTRTPVLIAACCLVLNILFIFVLVGPLLHVGIALATALSNWVNVFLLGYVLHRRNHFQFEPTLRKRIGRILLATTVMAIVLIGLTHLLGHWPIVLALAITIVAGCGTYIALAVILGAMSPRQLLDGLRHGST